MIDLLVAGAGPAGLVTALYAARAGLDVTVVDPRFAGSEKPIDKACGEGLMPGAVTALAELGVDPPGRDFRGIGYIAGRHRAEAFFTAGPGRGVRRTDLQSTLLVAVAAAGIPVLARTVGDVAQSGDRVRAAGVTARYLAAADGLHSPIARSLALEVAVPAGRRRWGLRRHFQLEPWSDLVQVHWSDHAEAYVTPVGPGLVGVAVLSGDRRSFDEHLAGFPTLAARLAGVPGGLARGAGPLRRRTSRRVAGRVLLVGDAAGYVDALTGEGIAVSLACARALVDCLVAGRPADYERRWSAQSRRYRAITSSLLWATRRPGLRRALVPAAQRVPWVFSAAVRQLAR
jgi:flavin-dependent dehydrogenase